MFVFMGCVHNPAYVEKEYDLSSDFEDIIVFETKGPYQKAEFVIDGHSDGSGVLHLFHPPYPEEEKRDKYRNGIIIEGDIKLEFKKTWYMNEVLVKYIVFEPGTGRLRIRFRVF
jgi:hypothetical protein